MQRMSKSRFEALVHSMGTKRKRRRSSSGKQQVVRMNKARLEALMRHAQQNKRLRQRRWQQQQQRRQQQPQSTKAERRYPVWGKRPDVVVDRRPGKGNFTSIQAAVDAAPSSNPKRYVIYVRAGVYKEAVQVGKENITMFGDGPTKTIVTGSRCIATGHDTLQSATFTVTRNGFTAIGMRFENTGRVGQAVAIRVSSDRAVFWLCQMWGNQDTLYVYGGRQLYRKCDVRGSVDFIFGPGVAVFDRCTAVLRPRPDGARVLTIMASQKRDGEANGLVFLNGKVTAPPNTLLRTTFLGRPWGPDSVMVYINTFMTRVVRSEGWGTWTNDNTWGGRLFMAEYNSMGPGAVQPRVWFAKPGRLTALQAVQFLPDRFIQLSSWIRSTGLPSLDYTRTL
uniref:Pectinesterase n=1 Tax=Penium margaritaceum TaxID=102169 RepID=T1YUB6_9VIRI|nr:PME1 [Penium margaritaceum]